MIEWPVPYLHADVAKLLKDEVCLCFFVRILSPRIWLRAEPRTGLIYGFETLKFSFAHCPAGRSELEDLAWFNPRLYLELGGLERVGYLTFRK